MGSHSLQQSGTDMRKEMSLFLFLIFQLAQAQFPADTFPSCLQGNLTWDISGVFDIVVNVLGPEECQEVCSGEPACVAMTWLSADAALYPLTCALFSETSNMTTPCEECVSGPASCSCSIQGECDILEDNLVEIIGNVESVEICASLCSENSACNIFTYLGEENHFRHTCFLFSSCEVFTNDCEGCTSGADECNVCKFENTLPDGSCKGPCEAGWTLFDNHCYLYMNNSGSRYDDIEDCRSECSFLGGSLGSIHNKKEDDFVFNLIIPHYDPFYGLMWLGASCVHGAYEWDDGTPWDYENWNSGGSNSCSSSYPCVVLGDDYGDNSADKWTDSIVCQDPLGKFNCICEKDA